MVVRHRSSPARSKARLLLPSGAVVLALATTAAAAAPAVTHTWPGASYRPYSPTRSAFNWRVPAAPTQVADSSAIVASVLSTAQSGCDPSSAPYLCKPANLVASNDGHSGGGWPTYWAAASDPLIRVVCTGGPCPMPALSIHIPAGAAVQEGTPDAHLTVISPDRRTEYDFYQAAPAHVPSSGSISVTAEARLSLTGLGQQVLPGNTDAAGVGHLAGRIRVEELRSGVIDHALTIAVPCTRDAFVYPANHKAVPASCTGDQSSWPAMGQLFWLDLSPAQLASLPLTAGLPSWARTVMAAMHRYGMYVDDNAGPGSQFFELQTEAQSQYTSLGAADRWLSFARNHWVAGANNDWVGGLEGFVTTADQATAWRDFWQTHLHVLDPAQLPGQ